MAAASAAHARGALSPLFSTETGDEQTARKVTANLRPATAEERAWLEAAVKALTQRAGQVAAKGSASNLAQLTIGDLATSNGMLTVTNGWVSPHPRDTTAR